LLEILIVFGVTAILAAATAPGFFRYWDARQLTGRVNNVVALLRQTQVRAVSQEGGNQWGVHFEHPASGAKFYQVFSGTWATGTREIRTNIGSKLTFVAPASGNSTDVIFAKRTGLPTAATAITLALLSSTSTTQQSVTVTAQGTIEKE